MFWGAGEVISCKQCNIQITRQLTHAIQECTYVAACVPGCTHYTTNTLRWKEENKIPDSTVVVNFIFSIPISYISYSTDMPFIENIL